MRRPSQAMPAAPVTQIGAGPRPRARARRAADEEPGQSIEAALAALADAERDRRPAGRRGAAEGPASKARNLPVGMVIVNRRRRGESSIEETLLEVYHAALSVHEAEHVARTLWGPRFGVSAVAALGRKVARRIDVWRHRPIRGRYLYVFLTGADLKRSWGNGSETVGVLVALGVNAQGGRDMLGVVAGDRGDETAWLDFLRGLRQRGLTGVRLFIGDPMPGLGAGIAALFPGSAYQLCVLQFYRSVLALVPTAQSPAVEELLKTIHASDDRAAARARAAQIESTMRLMSLPFVAVAIAEYIEPTLSYFAFPAAHWRHLRSNHLLNRALRDVRERARLVCAFSDGPSAVHLVGARLRFLAERSWFRRRLAMSHVRGLLEAEARPGGA